MTKVSASFTLHDLKLFHHFLCFAYPPLPLGSKSAWTRDIPQLSHHSEPLMNALLALAASHTDTLSRSGNDICIALMHKGRAIAGLKDAFTRSSHSAADYDIMLAICYALTFQSALLPASAVDFVTFGKGCAMITERIQSEGKRTVFNLPGSSNTSPSQPSATAWLDTTTYPKGLSLEVLLSKGIVALCTAQTCIGSHHLGLTFLTALQSIFSGFQVSPSTGYHRFVHFYAVWFKLVEDVEVFSGDSRNAGSQLLWAFFIGLQLFTTLLIVDVCSHGPFIKDASRLDRSVVVAKITGMIEWLCAVAAMAPLNLQEHFSWPTLVSNETISRFNMAAVSGVGVQSKVETLCNLPSGLHNVLGNLLELSATLANWTEDLLSSRSGEEDFFEGEWWQTISTQKNFGVLDK